MGVAPLADPFHIGGPPEIISIGRLAQPALLTGRLAGTATSRGRTIKLAPGIMAVRSEEQIATAAFASVGRGTHHGPSRKKIPVSDQSQKPRDLEGRKRRRKNDLALEEGRKSRGRKRNFKPPENLHFQFAADTAGLRGSEFMLFSSSHSDLTRVCLLAFVRLATAALFMAGQ
jgi:hypothetical protein